MDINPLQTPVARRTVLVAAAATPLLVACSSSGDGGDDAPQTEVTTGTELAGTSDVPVGGGFINREAHVVVTQPEAGEYRAFSSICTHQSCDVGSVTNNIISCGCHGSKFSAVTGDVEQGPASIPLPAIAVVVEGAAIVRA